MLRRKIKAEQPRINQYIVLGMEVIRIRENAKGCASFASPRKDRSKLTEGRLSCSGGVRHPLRGLREMSV